MARLTPRPLRPARGSQQPVEPSSEAVRAKRWEVKYPATMALIAALAGALIGGTITSATTYLTQKQEFNEERQKEARERREKVYSDFFASAELAQNSARAREYQECRRVQDLKYVKGRYVAIDKTPACQAAGEKVLDQFSKLTANLSGVNIHGGKTAIEIANALVLALQVERSTFDSFILAAEEDNETKLRDATRAKAKAFEDSWYELESFRHVMCEDLNTTPSACSAPPRRWP